MEYFSVIQHLTLFIITSILIYYTVKIGRLTGYTKDWNLITIGFCLFSTSMFFVLLADANICIDIVYNIGLFIGGIGLIVVVYGVYTLYKRLEKMVK